MNQTIAIALQPVPSPVGQIAQDFNQLLTNICQFINASVSADVSFFRELAADPVDYQGDIIFNTTQGVFKRWDTGAGRYLAISPFNTGDTKTSFVEGDEVALGWIVLDGRTINSLTGITQRQFAILQQLFGDTLPTVAPIQVVSNLPVNGSFSGISVPQVAPPSGQIGALPFSGTYNPVEEQALASNAEQLRASVSSEGTAITAVRDKAEALLQALNAAAAGGSGQSMWVKVYCGQP